MFACNLEENAGIHSFASKQNLMKNGRSWKAFARNPKIFAYDICETGVAFSKKKKRRTFLPLRFTSLQKNVGRSVFYLSRRKWMLRLQFSLWKRGTFVCIGNVNLVEFIERSITGKYYYNSVNVTAILWFQLQPLFGDSR